ncbi:MAG TPA: sugar phosphate nucleotidyltransferase [Burkholderiales bacterium]|nr:sugar phosphate nucleotidyltransferase [Burkholderiales bacterium]
MKVLALVLAGGEGTRLQPLTAEHSKPALQFVNGYRIVDFVLSNLVNSGITTIFVLAQYKPQSLIRHIESSWRPELRRRKGYISAVLPSPDGPGEFRGTADAVYQNLHLIERHAPDLVAIFAADHVYRMDVGQMVAFHAARRADVSVAAAPVPIEQASSFGIIVRGPKGEVLEFQEKPSRPAPIPANPARAYASMGNYLFDPDVLAGLLHAAYRDDSTDFGRDILPRMAGRGRIYAYDFSRNYVPGVRAHEERAYWRDVGTLDALASARDDIRGPAPRFDLSNLHWPILGEAPAQPVTAREMPLPGRPRTPSIQLAAAKREENLRISNPAAS